MRRTSTPVLIILYCCLLFSCNPTKDIAGTYNTIFADLGLIGTTIRLMQDSSLQYISRGDIMYDTAAGPYSVRDHKVYIVFDRQPPDINNFSRVFSNLPLKTAWVSGDIVHYQFFCFIGRGKLFLSHITTGRKINKAMRYNKKKKYFLFGNHFYK